MPCRKARWNMEFVTQVAADPIDPGEACALIDLKKRFGTYTTERRTLLWVCGLLIELAKP